MEVELKPDTDDNAVIITATNSAKKVTDEANDEEKKDTDSPSPKKPKSTKKKKKKIATTTKKKKKKSITDNDDVDIDATTSSPSSATAATTSYDTQSDDGASPPKLATKSARSLTKTKSNKSTKSKSAKSARTLTKTKSNKSTKSNIKSTKSLGGEVDRKKSSSQSQLSLSSNGVSKERDIGSGRDGGRDGGRGRGPGRGRGRGRGRDPSLRGIGRSVSENGDPGRGRGRGRGRDPSLRGIGRSVSEKGETSQRMKSQKSIRVDGRGRGINGGRSSIRSIDTNERGTPQTGRGRGPRRAQSNGRQKSFRRKSARSFDTSTHSKGSADSWLDEKKNLQADKADKRAKSARNIYMAPAVDIYRAPRKPQSILRRSSHNQDSSKSSHRSMMASSSHRARRVSSTGSLKKASGRAKEENSSELYSNDSFDDDAESYVMDINDDGDDDRSFANEDPDEKTQQEGPSNIIGSFVSKSLRSIVSMDISGHSVGLGAGSSHHGGLGTGSSHHTSSARDNDNFNRRSGLSRSNSKQTQSMRSVLSVDQMEFMDENICIRSLRYIRIMAPHPDENPIKKKIRIFTWMALMLDFLNALVAIITYGGETTQCCGMSIMSAFGGTDYWDLIIKIITCGYMLLIFLEVFPVITGGFPFNLFNPFIGFLITFAVFFSDSMVEAAVMWTIEACAVFCELYIYRLLLMRFNERKSRLKNTRKEIAKLRKIKRKVKDQFENGKVLTRANSQDVLNIDYDDDDSFAEDDTFLDEMETQKNHVGNRTALVTAADISTVRETRLLRERRKLIQSQTEEERDLRYHFVGVSINVFLVVFSLLMIIIIAKNGGMCIKGMQFGNIFKNDQLDKCNLCVDVDGPCEKCSWEDAGETIISPNSQCYYPYG